MDTLDITALMVLRIQNSLSFATNRKDWPFCDIPDNTKATPPYIILQKIASTHHLNIFKYTKYYLD